MDARGQRYSIVSIALHWLMAAAIAMNIWVGLWMSEAIEEPETRAVAYEAFQFHKSLGLTILVLAVLRLIWRLSHKMLPLPDHMPAWQKMAARASHVLLYAFMLLMPLTGWLYVSTGWNHETDSAFEIPTMWFGQFQWPHVPGVSGASGLAEFAVETHELLAWGFMALLALHVAGALKHHFLDRDDVLWSMLPIIRRPAAAKAAQPRTDGQ